MVRSRWVMVMVACVVCVGALGIFLHTSHGARSSDPPIFALWRRWMTQVANPLRDLPAMLERLREAGKDPTAEPAMLRKVDAISDNAWQVAAEGRRNWCESDATDEFYLYMIYSEDRLAADCAWEYVHANDAEARVEGPKHMSRAGDWMGRFLALVRELYPDLFEEVFPDLFDELPSDLSDPEGPGYGSTETAATPGSAVPVAFAAESGRLAQDLADERERLALMKRFDAEVLSPLGSLPRTFMRRADRGEDPLADPGLVGKVDAIAESAWQITEQSRRLWCRTEAPRDFYVCMGYSEGLLAADCAAYYVRIGDTSLIAEVRSHGQRAGEWSQKFVDATKAELKRLDSAR